MYYVDLGHERTVKINAVEVTAILTTVKEEKNKRVLEDNKTTFITISKRRGLPLQQELESYFSKDSNFFKIEIIEAKEIVKRVKYNQLHLLQLDGIK